MPLSDPTFFSDAQVFIITTIIGLFLTYITTRTTASSGAVNALATTVTTLRNELKEQEREQKEQQQENTEKINAEIAKRQELEGRIERERVKYQLYIKELLEIMRKNNIQDIPEWDIED